MRACPSCPSSSSSSYSRDEAPGSAWVRAIRAVSDVLGCLSIAAYIREGVLGRAGVMGEGGGWVYDCCVCVCSE